VCARVDRAAGMQSLKRFLAVIFVTCFVLCVELALFYLKYLLFIPPTHTVCVARTILWMLGGSVAVREAFQYMDDA
jgi:phosphatidylserine synthase 2